MTDKKNFQSQEEELVYLREQQSKVTDRYRRQWIKNQLFVKKAKSAGITVTNEEIDQYINEQYKH